MAPNGALPANYRVGIESSRLRARSDRFHDKRFDRFLLRNAIPVLQEERYPRERIQEIAGPTFR